MTDQNMVKGDSVYPNILHVDEIPVKAALVFVKGELATIDPAGFLIKLTGTKIAGLVQVRNAVTGGSGDGDVTVSCNIIGTRILMNVVVNAKKGDLINIGADGVADALIGTVAGLTATLGIGRLFGLYKNTALVSAAGDLALIDMGVY